MSDEFSTNNLFSTGNISHSEDAVSLPEVLFPISNVKNQHESDEICISCSCKYNVPGLSHTKKLYCHFCYRGTCARCLSYEYYHQEKKTFSPMCASCNAKLTAMSSSFQSEISECQLERTELRREIILAEQERKHYQNERRIIEDHLTSYKASISLVQGDENNSLSKVKEEHDKLKERQEAAETYSKDLDFQLKLIHDRVKSQQKSTEEARHRFHKHHEEELELKSALHEIELKISSLKQDKTEEVLSVEIISLKSEVIELKHRKNHEKQKLEKKIEENAEIKERVKNNEYKINELTEKLAENKSPEDDKFTDDEEHRLKELKTQIKDLEELIIINEKRLKHSKEKNSLKFSISTDHSTSKKQSTSSSSKEDPNGDTNCCAKCIIH